MRFIDQETEQYPPFPEHYFNTEVQAVFSAYAEQVKNALGRLLAVKIPYAFAINQAGCQG
jgi:homoserine O-succinyltransferase